MNWLESWLRKRFVRLNGEGDKHQHDLYRCTTCGSLVTWNKIRSGEMGCCNRMVPSAPKWYEVIKLLLFRS